MLHRKRRLVLSEKIKKQTKQENDYSAGISPMYRDFQQPSDEKRMVRRMHLYFAMLWEKFNLPVKQFVVYIGQKPPKMPKELVPQEIFTGFDMVNLHDINYKGLLDSSIPEEILLATLGNFNNEEAPTVLGKIISKLQKLSTSKTSLHKYIRQLNTLARLRNLIPQKSGTSQSSARKHNKH